VRLLNSGEVRPLLGRRGIADGAVANGKPEFVLQALRMQIARVIRIFVLVLDQNALRIRSRLGFAGGFGGDVVDGADRGLGVFLFAGSERQSENHCPDEQQKAQSVLLPHSAYLRWKFGSAQRVRHPDGAMIIRIGTERT